MNISLQSIGIFVSLVALTTQCNVDQYSGLFSCNNCRDSIDDCYTCSSRFVCTQCYTGYKLKSGFLGSVSCTGCGINACVSYSSGCNCGQCQSNYYFVNVSGIIQCAECGVCTCSNNYCTGCSSGYFLTHNSGQPTLTFCQACESDCETCDDDVTCTHCNSGFYLQSDSCFDCPSTCECANSQYCSSCLANKYRNSSSGCSDCPSLCICENEGYCTSCIAGAYKDGNGDCQDCPATCQCQNSTYCTSCVADGYRNGTGGCEQCPSLCVCQNETYCTSCVAGNYINGSGDCEACPSLCECQNSTYCTSCVANAYRNGSDCYDCPSLCVCQNEGYCTSCLNGAYINSNGDCQSCPSLCFCENSTYCTSCVANAYRNGSDCEECPTLCVCQNQGYCTSCLNGAFINSTGDCQQCPTFCICANDTYCTSCVVNSFRQTDGSCGQCPVTCFCDNQVYCSRCALGASFDVVTNVCTEICGDGIVLNITCDLGVGNIYDGCNDDCSLEDNFDCYRDDTTALSVCSYEGLVEFIPVNMTKEMYANEITIYFQPSPPLHAFLTIDPNNFLSFNDPALTDPSFSYENGYFKATFSYNEEIYNQQFKLQFNPSESVDRRFYTTNGSEWSFIIKNDDAVRIAFYASSQYALSQIITIFSILIVVGGVMVCFMGIFSPNKLAGLQIMFVIQYGSICLLWISGQISLPIYCLKNLIYSTGYNHQFSQNLKVEQPPHALTYDFNGIYFSSNFNFIAILYVLPLLPLLISKIIYLRKTNTEQKLNAEEKVQFFCELMMYMCMFNFTFLVGCCCVYFMYGDTTDVASLALAGSSIFLTLCTFIGFAAKPAFSLKFRFSFKRKELNLRHYFFHIIAILLSVIFLCILPPWAPFIPQILMLIYTLVGQPYKKLSQNLRSAYNYLSIIICSSMVLYLSLADENSKMGWGGHIYPLVLELLMMVGVIWAFIVVIKDIYFQRCKKKEPNRKKMTYQMFNDQELLKKYQSQVVYSDLFKARKILKSFDPEAYSSTVIKGMNLKKGQIKEDEDVVKWLKKENLPASNEAAEMLMNEAEFIHYQNVVWMKRQKHMIKIDPEKKKVYDAI